MAVQTTEHAQQTPIKEKVGFEDFLHWPDEFVEWVDGEIIQMAPASGLHQDLGGFLEIILRFYSEEHHIGIVRRAPFVMRLPNKPSGREPDLLFVRQDRLHLLKRNYLDGPADMVLEIVSPESVERDYHRKFKEYELGGVKEYWLLDPDRQQAAFYELGDDGHYHPGTIEQGIYRSQVIAGFWLHTRWLWQEPLPRVREIVRELGIP